MSDNDLSSIFEIEICLDASFILKEKIQKKENVLHLIHLIIKIVNICSLEKLIGKDFQLYVDDWFG